MPKIMIKTVICIGFLVDGADKRFCSVRSEFHIVYIMVYSSGSLLQNFSSLLSTEMLWYAYINIPSFREKNDSSFESVNFGHNALRMSEWFLLGLMISISFSCLCYTNLFSHYFDNAGNRSLLLSSYAAKNSGWFEKTSVVSLWHILGGTTDK